MDDEAPQPPATPVAGKVHGPPAHPWSTARRRLAELVIVFVGVYAAFLLNRFDTDRRDAKRRAQILTAFEQEVSNFATELKGDLTQADEIVTTFDRRLAAGEMPPLSISFTATGYSPTDDATLLQAGGLELLDMQTIAKVREVNNLERSLLAFTHDVFELSLTELPEHNPDDFYDPATHQLKKRYDWYPTLQHSKLAQAKALLAAEERLLSSLRANRGAGAEAATPVPAPAGRTTR